MNLAILHQADICYEKGMARFSGDAALYEEMLRLFLEDRTLESATAALDGGDLQALFEALHELKGISGNLDMTELYRETSALVTDLRAGLSDIPTLRERLVVLSTAYRRVHEAILAAEGKEAPEARRILE